MKLSIIDTPKHLDKEIELFGWVDVRRDHGKLIFFDLRDRTGKVQLVIKPDDKELHKLAEIMRPEWVIRVKGKVAKRPPEMINPKEATGEFELKVKEITVLAEAKTSPFDISGGGYDIGEELRLKYRYLDLRRPRLQKNLKMRSEVIKFIRDFLVSHDFVEIETPILGKSTPEGARDYLVPARLRPGSFYALPQSPQQYKQLLMVAGFEKYFQIARCFRDEDTRGDRQPEFTQLDIEMSFVKEEEILNLIEELFLKLVKEFFPEKDITALPFPKIVYQKVMEKYKTDKPDLRENKEGKNELAFLFVTDFPMFEWRKEEKRWDTVHHPFTKIKTRSADWRTEIRKENAEKLMAHQYDFVLNGFEIGGGSIRENNPEILEKVFEIMGHKKEEVKEQFGHLLEAFRYGVPPHGGIALGLDRIVAVLLGEPNIREVIAFPKTGDGRDLMMDAPAEVGKSQLAELGITLNPKPKK
jgi:aspartyl-tRNA synthetase